MNDINQLHPSLIKKCYELVELCSNQGIYIGISECLRTIEEQDVLYAKGRTQPGAKVTNCRGITYSSMHQWGIAFDFYLKMDVDNDGEVSDDAYNDATGLFAKVGNIGKSIGLEWGGDWKSIKDKPHFQLPDWGSTASKLKSRFGIPENFMSTWSKGGVGISASSFGLARVIATSGVKLRSTPTTKEKNQIATIPYKTVCATFNTEVITGDNLRWVLVEYNNMQGYAAQKYLDIIKYMEESKVEHQASYSKNMIEPAKYRDTEKLSGNYKTTANLNLRSGAGTKDTDVITTIPKGNSVSCYGYYTTASDTIWLLVSYKKYTGYVSTKYLKK